MSHCVLWTATALHAAFQKCQNAFQHAGGPCTTPPGFDTVIHTSYIDHHTQLPHATVHRSPAPCPCMVQDPEAKHATSIAPSSLTAGLHSPLAPPAAAQPLGHDHTLQHSHAHLTPPMHAPGS